jgi:hypothetical protein
VNGGTRRRAFALYLAALVVVGMAANGNGFADLLPAEVQSVGTTVPRLTTVPPETTTSTSTSTTTSSTTTPTTAPVTTVARRAVAATTPATTAAATSSDCHPSYEGACVPIASDVDCAGGSGNGPAYVSAKNFRVVGPDVYGLDGNDNDGIACES